MLGVRGHDDVQPGQPVGEQQVAEVVLDREHDAADRASVQTQRRAHGGEHERPADIGEQAPVGAAHAHADDVDMRVEHAPDRLTSRGRVTFGHGVEQRPVVLHAMNLQERP